MFIGEIGVLDRKDMDHFAGIFIAYQKLGKSKKPEEKERLKEQLAPWSSTQSPGKMRVGCNQGSFTVRCVGVFDTVGSLGLPEELTLRAPKLTNLFGFPDRILERQQVSTDRSWPAKKSNIEAVLVYRLSF